jgi:hypothetical protein
VLYHFIDKKTHRFAIDQIDVKEEELHVIIFLTRRWMSLLHKQITNETTEWWNSSSASTTTPSV